MKEPNAVIGSLFENLDQIELIYKETYAPFKKDKGNTGDSKEYSIQEFIAAYLTNEYRIEKGSIFSLNGAQSNNIDCVILAPNHPMLTTPKRKIILAEGVFAAVEVKPELKIGSLTIKRGNSFTFLSKSNVLSLMYSLYS